jgi:hypothetical protein
MIGLCSLNIDIMRQSVDEAGGSTSATPCDVDLKKGAKCAAARLGNTCNGSLDQAGTGKKVNKLAQSQGGAKNCNAFFDNQGFVCATASEVFVLSKLTCSVAISPDEPL